MSKKWGFIDKTGKLVIPCKWKKCGEFSSEGVTSVMNEQNKYGLIDKTGEIIIPCQWNLAVVFYEGLALVENERGEYFCIDKTGKIVAENVKCRIIN